MSAIATVSATATMSRGWGSSDGRDRGSCWSWYGCFLGCRLYNCFLRPAGATHVQPSVTYHHGTTNLNAWRRCWEDPCSLFGRSLKTLAHSIKTQCACLWDLGFRVFDEVTVRRQVSADMKHLDCTVHDEEQTTDWEEARHLLLQRLFYRRRLISSPPLSCLLFAACCSH